MDEVVSTLFVEWDALSELVHQIHEDQWLQPSQLPDWTNFDILAHIIGTERFLSGQSPSALDLPADRQYANEVARLNDQWIQSLRRLSPSELIAHFNETISLRKQALTSITDSELDALGWTPIGQAPFRRFLQIRVFDCYVHEQDLRRSLNLPGHTSGVIAESSMDEVERALGYIIGKQARLPQGTSVQLCIVGGVQRTWNVAVNERAQLVESLAQPTCALRLDSNLFMALACGRVEPTAVAEEINIEGDQRLAQQVVKNLAFTI
ncbi:maleylpyruvate isomerase family mycothiol-dependent enzyme [Ferrimicrobium acidiphilum]|uniref:maleylpyruvate isomerase family mycothiol-dependent enzyme n=1 Tax=Ferrimicrobium acidiphilum TaxID=121039 RepID=UPI0023F10831|nr:maleylpyruvate isomerase family mycothiol-dependent enzyme [Ferrimicrobium acidiphilum]